MIRKCKRCNTSIEDKKANAVYCSDICRVRDYRLSHGISDPFNPSANVPPAKAELHPFYYAYPLQCCNKPSYIHTSNDIFHVQCLNCGVRWDVFITKSSR
jgi:hypothetical protein